MCPTRKRNPYVCSGDPISKIGVYMLTANKVLMKGG